MRVFIGMAMVAAVMLPFSAMAAEKPVAIVLEVTGNPSPTLSPYTEVTQGTTVTLPADTTIKFSHYDTCKDVTVTGGRVTFEDFEYTISDTKKVNETGAGCPQVIASNSQAANTGIAGGVVFRGAPTATGKLAKVQNTLILVGAKINDVARVKIEREGAPAVDWAPEQATRAFQVPEGVLKDDVSYSLVVYGWQGQELMRQSYRPEGGMSLIRVN